MKHQILIVEDDFPMRKLLKNVLKEKFKTEVSSDGIGAMELLSEGFIPDIIISDICMPNLDGISFVKSLSVSGLFKEIPVIILSGSNSKQDQIDCLNLGVFSYLEKPFKVEELLETINRALSKKLLTE